MLKMIHLNFSTEVLDEFRDHFNRSISQQEKSIKESFKAVSVSGFESRDDYESYVSSLHDDFWQSDEVRNLGEELSIVGLHRLVEIKIGKVLRGTFPNLTDKKRQDLIAGKSGVIDCPNLVGYAAANELRLINNCVKHNDSIVDEKLATAFPSWTKGEPLKNLGTHYSHLKEGVTEYIKAFVTEAHAKTTAFSSTP
ncbi:hypothetical protein PSCICL_30430 [Pseudomonas cichorii]|nr:hypothetical protein [Pseudomonas cichorii]GFM72051.1 hypothetical protein PSCICL_30430 [Pseudomonas cichorii]